MRLSLALAAALWAVLGGSAQAGEAEADWRRCHSDLPGRLSVKAVGCAKGRLVMHRYAEKAQREGPTIRVLGYRCRAFNGYSPILCSRDIKRIRYVGSFERRDEGPRRPRASVVD